MISNKTRILIKIGDKDYELFWTPLKQSKNITFKYLSRNSFKVTTPLKINYSELKEAAIKIIPRLINKVNKRKLNTLYFLNLPELVFCSNGLALNLKEMLSNSNIDWNKFQTSLEYRKTFYPFLSQKLLENNKTIFLLRLETWFQVMELNKSFKMPQIQFKWLNSKWGSYSKSKHQLIFNIKLLCFPFDYWDLIIVHELNHLIHYHHQKSFYLNLKKYLPNYRELEKNLVAIV